MNNSNTNRNNSNNINNNNSLLTSIALFTFVNQQRCITKTKYQYLYTI